MQHHTCIFVTATASATISIIIIIEKTRNALSLRCNTTRHNKHAIDGMVAAAIIIITNITINIMHHAL
jgi:hypothetical protein